MAGRNKQPISLVEHKGKKHLTKEEIKKRKEEELVTPNDKVEPPDYLPARLKKRFKEISEELIKIGIMSNLDNEALARYLVSEDTYQRLSKKMVREDALDDLEAFDKISKTQERMFKQARAAATDLGLTISSRCKLVVPKKPEEKESTPEEKLFGGILG